MSDLTDRIASDVTGIFARTSDFGTESTFIFGSITRTIDVLFDENFSGYDIYSREITNTGPMAWCATSDIANDANLVPGESENDAATIEINSIVYNIIKCARAGDTCALTLSKD